MASINAIFGFGLGILLLMSFLLLNLFHINISLGQFVLPSNSIEEHPHCLKIPIFFPTKILDLIPFTEKILRSLPLPVQQSLPVLKLPLDLKTLFPVVSNLAEIGKTFLILQPLVI